jgi:ABC-2 type transport system permease protein
MGAVYKKEMISYFSSIIGYIVVAVVIAFGGYFYTLTSLNYSNSDMRGMFNGLASVLIFVIPMLTMKLLSEEKKNRTDRLMFTLPLEAYEIVLGKFLAALTIFVAALAVTFSFAAVVMLYGRFQAAMILGNYLALILLAGLLISLGLLISSLTDHQIVAAVLSFLVIFGSYAIGNSAIVTNHAALDRLLRFLAVFSHHKDFTYGYFALDELFYFVSLTALFLFLTARIIETKRYD